MSDLTKRVQKAYTAVRQVFFPSRPRDAYDPNSKPKAANGGLGSEHSNYVVPSGQELPPDVDVIPDSPLQRRRCTLAYFNNTLVKGIVDSEVRQVCGSLKVQALTPSAAANSIIQDEWHRRLEEGLHSTITMGFRHVLAEGGVLVRPLGSPVDPLDFEPIPYRRVRTPYGIVENGDFPQYDQVRDGFKRDAKGNIIGYYILEEESAYDTVYPVGRYVEEKLFAHPALTRLIGQSKGLSWYASAVSKLEMVSRWMNALLRAQEIHAYVVAVVRTPKPDARGLANVNTSIDPANSKAMQNFANQHRFLYFPDMADFKIMQSNAPIISDFLIWNLRMIARSMGVSYERLTYDLSNTSFSSTKFGDRDDLMNVHEHQKLLELNMLKQLHRRLVAGLYMRPDLKMPGAGVFASNPDACMGVHFQFPGRPPVDEAKAEEANKLALTNRTACRTDIAAQRGQDAKRILEKLTEEDSDFLAMRKAMWMKHGFDQQTAELRAADELFADKSKNGAVTPGIVQEDIEEPPKGKKKVAPMDPKQQPEPEREAA